MEIHVYLSKFKAADGVIAASLMIIDRRIQNIIRSVIERKVIT